MRFPLSWALACAALLAPALARAQANAGPNGTIYVGTYAKTILVVDERTMTVRDTIPVSVGIPANMLLTHDRKKLYVMEPAAQDVEVFDLTTGRALDRFTLSDQTRKVRIWGLNVDPLERFAVLLVKTTTKKIDRFEIGPPTLLRYDLKQHTVTDTIPWPQGEEREGARIIFSPDGKYLYFLTDEILIYDAQTMKQVDRWQLATALEEGMGRFNFGLPDDIYEEPGFYTGLFRVTDPVQNRQLMGVARVNLTARSIDFYTLGPNQPISFRLGPDRRKAYGLRSQTGNYEFWTFDLENRRVGARTPFTGRPRMGLTVSTDGRSLYIHTAGPTIDIYDASTFRLVRTVDLGADMTRFLLLPSADAQVGR
jgi:DNA-binding beta-propeller fold protein YncE